LIFSGINFLRVWLSLTRLCRIFATVFLTKPGHLYCDGNQGGYFCDFVELQVSDVKGLLTKALTQCLEQPNGSSIL